MPEQEQESQRLQWKWVWITLGMFVLLYVLPLLGASSIRGNFGDKIIGGWSFGGIIVISALAGFLSKGVTIWEPAIAGGFLTVIWYAGFQIISATKGAPVKLEIGPLLVIMVAIFGLSLLGAGLGEGIQNLSKRKSEAGEHQTTT